MGTGKSQLARNLSGRLRIPSLNSDVVRKELFLPAAASSRQEEYGQGIYQKDRTDLTYEKLIAWAEERLRSGKSALLDASFKNRSHRDWACQKADAEGARWLIIECVAPEEVIRQRLEKRLSDPEEPSDGRWELWATQKKDFDSFQARERQLVIDTSGNEVVNLARIFRRLNDRN
jgi:predicted kinase